MFTQAIIDHFNDYFNERGWTLHLYVDPSHKHVEIKGHIRRSYVVNCSVYIIEMFVGDQIKVCVSSAGSSKLSVIKFDIESPSVFSAIEEIVTSIDSCKLNHPIINFFKRLYLTTMRKLTYY